MSKPALGRGLGDLMGKAASPKTNPGAELQERESAAGVGVGSLLKGSRSEILPEVEEPAAEDRVTPPLAEKVEMPFPLWYLFAADIVLLLFAFLLVFKDPAIMDWKRICLASVATMLGGALAAAGVLLAQKKR
ncbi:MAG: hypothetical protein H0X66_20310 [Verrucomicrobia bacterium]|nr:hypothetical protein [Verrucomicrobiota bacterium]